MTFFHFLISPTLNSGSLKLSIFPYNLLPIGFTYFPFYEWELSNFDLSSSFIIPNFLWLWMEFENTCSFWATNILSNLRFTYVELNRQPWEIWETDTVIFTHICWHQPFLSTIFSLFLSVLPCQQETFYSPVSQYYHVKRV